MGIKKILLKCVGEKRYLSLMANSFQRLYRMGWLGKDYQDIYFLKRFIREGDWCLDIGAHLGYFSLELSRLVREPGRVFAVEPMSKFNRILQQLLQRHRIGNVTIYPVALGGKGEWVEMGIPEVGQQKKFAYARVVDPVSQLHYVESEKVRNESGDRLFRDLPRVDFVKCDVEGLEYAVFSSLLETIGAHHPLLLGEFADGNERVKVFELLKVLGYQAYNLEKDKWRPLDVYAECTMTLTENSYFLHSDHEQRFAHLIGPSYRQSMDTPTK
jgi:FkbM family methyltransferase